MSTDEKEEGGIVLGGIGFGVGGKNDEQPAEAELGEHLLPLRMIAVADLVPRDEHNAGPSAPDEAVRVDVGHFDEIFRKLALRLRIEVDSVLTPGKKARIDFAPSAMKSFRPDSLVRDIPLLRSLLDGKKVLERLREGTLDIHGAQSELDRLWLGSPLVSRVLGGVETKQPARSAPAAKPQTRDADVMRILDMVDTGTRADATASAPSEPLAPPGRPEKKGLLDDFIGAMLKGKGGVKPDAAIALVEKALGLQLGAILGHPEMRRLERAWRGLAFLASRTPKQGARLEVVSAREEQAAEALARALRAGIEPPVSVAVVDVTIDASAASLARLRALADVGEAQVLPILLNASPGLFARDTLDEIDRLDNKQALFDAPERAPWRSEAFRPAALWVSLALNRVLARLPYDARTARVREAQLAELPGGDEATVWMSPCWALASLVTKSFERTGWPCRITGAKQDGIVEDLPVREVAYGSSERIAIPTEAFFSTETQKALARIGLCALASQPNSDSVYLLSAATAYVTPPKRTYEGTAEPELRLPQTPLGDQLFVARIVQFLGALGARIGLHEDPGDVKQFLEAALHQLFEGAAAPPGPEIHFDVHRDDRGMQAQLTLRPRRFLGVQTEEVTLGIPLG